MINDLKSRAHELLDALTRHASRAYGSTASRTATIAGLIEAALQAAIDDHTFQLRQAGVQIPEAFQKTPQLPVAYENAKLDERQLKVGKWLHRIDRMMGPGEYDAEALTQALAVALVSVVVLETKDNARRLQYISEAVSTAWESAEESDKYTKMQTDQRYS